jgi:hypothetical protein
MDRAYMKPRRARGWLSRQGIKPAFSLQDNKDFAFLRKDVEALIAKHAAEESQRSALPGRTCDVRPRLVRAVANGAEIKATAKKLGVPYRAAVRWVTRWRTRGLLEPRRWA